MTHLRRSPTLRKPPARALPRRHRGGSKQKTRAHGGHRQRCIEEEGPVTPRYKLGLHVTSSHHAGGHYSHSFSSKKRSYSLSTKDHQNGRSYQIAKTTMQPRILANDKRAHTHTPRHFKHEQAHWRFSPHFFQSIKIPLYIYIYIKTKTQRCKVSSWGT